MARSITEEKGRRVIAEHTGRSRYIFGWCYKVECLCGDQFRILWPRNNHKFHVFEQMYDAGTPKKPSLPT